MAPRRTPWAQAILDHAADGRWYHRDELVAIGAAAVPPGRAIQQREARTLRDLARRGRIERDGHLIRRAAV